MRVPIIALSDTIPRRTLPVEVEGRVDLILAVWKKEPHGYMRRPQPSGLGRIVRARPDAWLALGSRLEKCLQTGSRGGFVAGEQVPVDVLCRRHLSMPHVLRQLRPVRPDGD